MEEKEGERGSLHNCKIENENSKEKQVVRKATSMETDEALGRRCKGNEAEGKGQAQRALHLCLYWMHALQSSYKTKKQQDSCLNMRGCSKLLNNVQRQFHVTLVLRSSLTLSH